MTKPIQYCKVKKKKNLKKSINKKNNNKILKKSLPQISMQRNRGKQQNGKDCRSLQENQRYQGNISCKDGLNKGRNGMDLTVAEDIKKR